MSISCVILAKNEEENIEECLNTLKWCDDRIVVDDDSTDKTYEIAKENEVNVYKQHLNNNFSLQRNFGLSRAIGEWVLFVDADERISEALHKEIVRNIKEDVYDGFYLTRKDFMWGKELKHGEVGSIKLLRLAKKNKGTWMSSVHEKWKIDGKTKILNNPLFHYPHPSLEEFLSEIKERRHFEPCALLKKVVG